MKVRVPIGSEDPKEKPKEKNVYTSLSQINKDNDWVRAFLERHGVQGAQNYVVGRDIGNEKPKFVYANGSVQPDKPILQTVLPKKVNTGSNTHNKGILFKLTRKPSTQSMAQKNNLWPKL